MSTLQRLYWGWKWFNHREKYPVNHFGHDFIFYVDTLLDITRAETLIHEKECCKWLLYEENGVFWDIGSYHGHYAIIADKLGFKSYAFEPLDENLEILYRNKSLNESNISIHNMALGDENKNIQIHYDESSAEGEVIENKGHIQMYQGDNILNLNSICKPTHIKIDTEGYEINVLHGLTHTLGTVKKILIEIHDEGDLNTVINILETNDFHTFIDNDIRSETYVMGDKNDKEI